MRLVKEESYYLRYASLILPATLSFIGYAGIAFWFPLLPYFNHVPQYDIRSFTESMPMGLLYAAVLVVLFYFYGLIYRALRQSKKQIHLWMLILTIVCFSVPLIFTYPINSTDIYRYIIRGRVKSIYGENQFDVPPNSIPNDGYTPFAGEWADETTPYGPVWELVATAVTAITRNRLGAGLLIFKLIALSLHVGIGWIIWHIQAKQTPLRQRLDTWLWLGNPALLLTFAVHGHNDALMIFWGMLSFLCLQRKRPFLALTFAILAPLTKPIGLLALPFIGLASWQQTNSWRRKGVLLLFSVVMTAVLVTLTFLPFGSPIDLVQRLLRELSSGGGFSILVLIYLYLIEQGVVIGTHTLSTIAQPLFILMTLILIWLTINGRSPKLSITNTFSAYLIQALNFRIWYASWLLPWLIIDEKRSKFWLKTAVFFLLTTQLSVIIYGHLRVYELDGNQLHAHLIGVPFTFILPLFLAKLFSSTTKKGINRLLHRFF